jgi:site-specific DNA-methyltransferase (adenine-specific)
MMIEEQKDDSGSVPLPFGKQTVVGSTVILGDCVEVMKGFEDNQFDLAIVDPPYGIGWDKEFSVMSAGIRKDGTKRKMKTWSNPKAKGYKTNDWDKSIPTQEYWEELFRVSKKQIIWGGNYFTDYIEPSGGWIIWDKGVPDGMTLSQAEMAWTNCLNSIKICKVLWAGYKKAEAEERVHPTQKPVKLYKWILKNYAKEGMTILDTHLGSGSNRIACDNMGFDFTGIEIDKEYFDLSEKRFKQYKSQLRIEGW